MSKREISREKSPPECQKITDFFKPHQKKDDQTEMKIPKSSSLNEGKKCNLLGFSLWYHLSREPMSVSVTVLLLASLTSESLDEAYWKALAEEREKALNDTIEENSDLNVIFSHPNQNLLQLLGAC